MHHPIVSLAKRARVFPSRASRAATSQMHRDIVAYLCHGSWRIVSPCADATRDTHRNHQPWYHLNTSEPWRPGTTIRGPHRRRGRPIARRARARMRAIGCARASSGARTRRVSRRASSCVCVVEGRRKSFKCSRVRGREKQVARARGLARRVYQSDARMRARARGGGSPRAGGLGA
jgi:hypothetical protein